MLAALNVALRFVLELAAVVAVGWWGLHAADGGGGWPLAIGAVAAFVAVWGLFIAPRARYPQSPRFRLWVGTGLLELAAVALAACGSVTAGVVLAALVGLNAVGIAALGDGGFTA